MMNKHWLIHTFIITAITFNQNLLATAISIDVLLSHPNLLTFLIGEEHTLRNLHEGGNRACIEKMVGILKRAKDNPHVRYRVLVEVSKPTERSPDFLTHLVEGIQDLPGVIIENIETRKLSKAALHILERDSRFYSWWYKEARDREGSAQHREHYNKAYDCELDKLTFADVLAELRQQKENALILHKNWPEEHDIDHPFIYEEVCNNLITASESYIQDLEALLKEYGMDPQKTIFDVADDIINFQEMQDDLIAEDKLDQSEYINGRAKIVRIAGAIEAAASDLFDFFLINRMLQQQKIADTGERIIVIAGWDHTHTASNYLRRLYEFERCARYADHCLKPDHFDVIEQSLEFFKEQMVKTKAAEELLHQEELSLIQML